MDWIHALYKNIPLPFYLFRQNIRSLLLVQRRPCWRRFSSSDQVLPVSVSAATHLFIDSLNDNNESINKIRCDGLVPAHLKYELFVLTCGIIIPLVLFLRLEWHNVFWFMFGCRQSCSASQICVVTNARRVDGRARNILMILPYGLTAAK